MDLFICLLICLSIMAGHLGAELSITTRYYSRIKVASHITKPKLDFADVLQWRFIYIVYFVHLFPQLRLRVTVSFNLSKIQLLKD